MDMSRVWTIRPHYVPRPVGDDQVLLLTESQKHRLLKGRLYARTVSYTHLTLPTILRV